MTLTERLKGGFIAGLILLTPLVITAFVLRLLVNWSRQVVDPVVELAGLTQYTANDGALAQVLAAVLIVGVVVALGTLARWSVGRRLFGGLGRVVNLVPLVSTIYSTVRQVANSLVDRDSAYESVVLVEYPREGIYSIGLVTGESPRAVAELAGESVYNVFLPNSPNPTGGRLVLLPESQLHEIDVSVRRGMRLVVTTGIGVDDEQSILPALEESDEPTPPIPAGDGRGDAR